MPNSPEDNHNGRPFDKGTLEAQFEQFRPAVDDEAPRALTAEEEKRLWRKVDLRLMPILSAMYLLAFMDRGMSHKFGWTISS